MARTTALQNAFTAVLVVAALTCALVAAYAVQRAAQLASPVCSTNTQCQTLYQGNGGPGN